MIIVHEQASCQVLSPEHERERTTHKTNRTLPTRWWQLIFYSSALLARWCAVWLRPPIRKKMNLKTCSFISSTCWLIRIMRSILYCTASRRHPSETHWKNILSKNSSLAENKAVSSNWHVSGIFPSQIYKSFAYTSRVW